MTEEFRVVRVAADGTVVSSLGILTNREWAEKVAKHGQWNLREGEHIEIQQRPPTPRWEPVLTLHPLYEPMA